nr:hypothetical protein [Tanacetum cinerariifolium]
MKELCQPSLNGRATVSNTHNVYAAGAYRGNSYQPQGNRNLLSYRSDNYLGPPGLNQNQNRNNQNHNFQNQNRNQGNHHNHYRNNQGRNQFFQGANQDQNQPPAYQALVYQALVHQPQIPQPHVVTTNEFTNFMKANDVILKNMKTNTTSLTNSNFELKNMFGQFMKMNTASSLGLETLLGNTITNPKEYLKGITTRSGTTYQGPMIPATSSFSIVEHETEANKDTMHPINNESTKDVQPLVVPTESTILNSEPVISPIIEPVDSPFGPSIKSLLTNKDKLCELAKTPLNEHCSTVLLKKLQEKQGDPGKFLIPCDFSGMAECLALADLGASINLMPFSVWNKLLLPDLSPTYFNADPRVPLILGRSFLKTGRALIDVFKGELTLHVGKEAITFNLDQTSSGNLTPYYDPIVSTTSLTLTPFENSDFLLEEVDAFLALKDDPTSLEVDQSYVDTEGDILLLEAFLNDDPLLPLIYVKSYIIFLSKLS